MPKSQPLHSRGIPSRSTPVPTLERAKRKFYRIFPEGFRDETYLAWERDYKWDAHREWETHLNTDAGPERKAI